MDPLINVTSVNSIDIITTHTTLTDWIIKIRLLDFV